MITPRQADKLIKSGEIATFDLLPDGRVQGIVIDRPDRWNVKIHMADEFGEFVSGRVGLFDRSDVAIAK